MRNSRIRNCNVLVSIVLLVCGCTPCSAGPPSALFVKSRSKASLKQQQQQQQLSKPQDVLQIVETEMYGDDKQWSGAKASRWSDLKGRVSEPPPTIEPPNGYQFEGDWKIVTSNNRDSLGWEYVWAKDNPAMRRRLWLRTIVPIPVQPSQSIVASLKEHWNFKGFGVSVYKSLLFARSVGVAFRLPILYNLDWWERHPGLPSLSTAVSCYFPPMAIYMISGSLNVDFVAWLLGRSSRIALYGLCVVLLSICRLMFLPVALLLYPSRKKLVLPVFPLPQIPTTPAVYSLTISQRLGMTVSWRVSRDRGYEFRTSYWYQYLPTMLHLFELFHRNRQLSDTKMTNWLRRKTASMGVSCGGPLPMHPGYFLTACMTMSGFHFRNPLKNRSVSPSIQQTKTLKEELEQEELELDESSTIRKQKRVG